MPLTYLTFPLPGIGGLNTDQPAWTIGASQCVVLKDAIAVNGVLTQRRGWTYRVTNTVAGSDTARPMDSFSERLFVRAKRNGAVATQGKDLWVRDTTASPGNGDWRKLSSLNVSTTNSTSGGSGVWRSSSTTTINNTVQDQTVASSSVALKRSARYLPRTYYNDELIYCASDGYYPALRYSGAFQSGTTHPYFLWSGTSPTFNPVFENGKSAARLAVNGTFSPGMYWTPTTGNSASASFRMNSATSGYWDLPGFKANASTSQPTVMETYSFGCMWGGCEIYSEGTVTIAASGALTFSGANFDADGLLPANAAPYYMMGDVILVEREVGISWTAHPLLSVTSSGGIVTAATTGSSVATGGPFPFAIGRRMGVRDVATHNGVLFGAGSVMKPSRVWYTEPGWTASMPPELGAPEWAYDGAKFYESRAGRFRFVDVPAEDTNEIVAIVTTDGPLLVLKNNAVYGIYGAFPNLTQSLITAGAGCIDVRSAISVDGYGTFWAGPNGVYQFQRGKITDLTRGRVSKEWTRRIKAYRTDQDDDNSVACGVAQGHLIVSCSVGEASAKDQWTWVCDLSTGAWSELTNVNSRYFQTVFTNAGIEATLATLGATGVSRRPINVQPALSDTGTAQDGDGYYPKLVMETGAATDGDQTPGRESRLTDVSVDYLMWDTGTASTTVSVSVKSTGGTDQSPDLVTDGIGLFSAGDDPYTHKVRLHAGTAGRENRIRLEVTAVSPNNQTVQIHEIGATVRVKKPER